MNEIKYEVSTIEVRKINVGTLVIVSKKIKKKTILTDPESYHCQGCLYYFDVKSHHKNTVVSCKQSGCEKECTVYKSVVQYFYKDLKDGFLPNLKSTVIERQRLTSNCCN